MADTDSISGDIPDGGEDGPDRHDHGDPEDFPDRAAGEPEVPAHRGFSFYLLIVLMAILIFLVVFVNVPGIRAAAGSEMTKTGWELVSYADAGGTLVPVLPGSAVTAFFGRDGHMDGTAGCNQYTASWSVTDYAIRIGSPVGTKRFCNTPGLMEQENDFLSDLPRASLLRIGPETLKIYDAAGKPLLVFNATG